jgi:deoxyribodipyrimidine photo-lyase
MLNPEHALLTLYPDVPRVFIFDTAQIERDHFSLRRLQFIADCVSEIPNIQVYKGTISEVLKELGTEVVITQKTPQLHISSSLNGFKVHWHDEPEFVSFRGRLKRFMHYWKAVEPDLIGPTQAEQTLLVHQTSLPEPPQLSITFEDAA